jgi:uncharacterized protein (DUF433 family)
MTAVKASSIVKTPGVCGGVARIANHRITVAHLVWYRQRGMGNDKLLESFPTLTAEDLEACWDYYQHHTNEIERDIWFNDVAANVPDATTPPSWVIVAGLLLGIPEAEVRNAFEPPLTTDQIGAAWDDYWRNPAGVDQDIAHYRRAG